MALLIVVSLLLINNFLVTTTGTQPSPPKTELLSWYDNSGTYHFLAFSTNQFGQPLSGVNLQANLTVSELLTSSGQISGTSVSSYPIFQGPLVSTNSSGEAEFTINVPTNEIGEVNANYSVELYENQSNGFSTIEGGYVEYYSESTSSSSPSPISPGQVISVASGNPISTVSDSSNSSRNYIQVIWAGANGSLPTHFSLYYQFINGTEVCTKVSNGESCHQAGNSSSTPVPLSSLNESNMQFLANLTTYHNIFPLPKLEANLTIDSELVINLFYPNGTTALQTEFGVVDLYPLSQIFNQPPNTSVQNVSSFFLGVYGIFIPLITIIVAYNSYGRYRLSGVLESILAKPVSRRGVALARFLSTFVAMAIAISISMMLVDFIVWSFTSSFVSSTTILASAGAFFVEVATFIAIMMLLSHVVRTTGALIGVGIGIFVLFDFFWALLISLVVGISQTSYGSAASYGYIVAGEFLNPAQFVGLVDAYLTHQVILVGLSLYTFPISAGEYGLTIPSILATGILWIALPLTAFLYLAIKKD